MRNMWLSSIGRAKKVILLIWLLSAVLAIPTAIRIDYETNISLSGHRVHWCRRRFPNGFLGYSRIKLNRIYAVYQVSHSNWYPDGSTTDESLLMCILKAGWNVLKE
ncbi:hypothetical protein ANCDUO_15033 [Ancylostoma duodenale]|uniref:Uncharacterized protein n=1 Tax=Ancylostoma duodenale TaxID=51022 RepID=A0A0C2CEP9_9BILA|nr:hypothetical protein ANCDUO_15033 [Ancylostoma duodenale]